MYNTYVMIKYISEILVKVMKLVWITIEEKDKSKNDVEILKQ